MYGVLHSGSHWIWNQVHYYLLWLFLITRILLLSAKIAMISTNPVLKLQRRNRHHHDHHHAHQLCAGLPSLKSKPPNCTGQYNPFCIILPTQTLEPIQTKPTTFLRWWPLLILVQWLSLSLSLSLSAWRACPPHQWHCFVSPLIKDSYPLQWFFALFFLSFWSCKNFHWILCLPAFSENWILKKRDNASIHVFVCCVVLSFPLQRGGPRCFVSVTASLFVVSPFPYHVLNLH